MLKVRRKKYESVLIDENIRVTVTQTHGGSVTLGIDAPRDVIVERDEVANPELVKLTSEQRRKVMGQSTTRKVGSRDEQLSRINRCRSGLDAGLLRQRSQAANA